MLNTCSIGRRWKPREGWSRPVLTGERGTLFPTRLLGRVSSCGGFFRWMARNAVSCGHGDDTGEAFCSRPLSGSRTATIGIGRVVWFRFCRPILVVGRCIGFAVVMAQVRRPVPFRTRKLRPGTAMVLHSRGCGRVARRRIHMLGVPVELRLREPFFVLCFAGQPTGVPHPGCRKACPVSGRLGLFRASKGNFCYSTKTSGEQIFFRNVLLTRYMIRFSEYGLWNGIGKDGNDVPEHRSAACTM